ncbi:YerC/YecD family TrpR-related protein [Vagococcus sp. PNs007]|uniref:YerC/YecD family TrpR-related protein n=1 Tax=Vagococcus proximus TaxID=2991417 RepID=A0ABT5X1J0_9ENTE|nr:YerC/YecD family TrpR-related protein [Vagococcus proximus]MDF0479866.1 YerC/YecD family TrpR-related protein [Vagococcus proximus]
MRIDQLKEQDIETFFKAVMSLENVDECYDFFDDLMTLKEMKIFLMRFNVAQMLLDGKTYQEIEAETHASTAIISRVKRSCEEGNQSYQLLRERLVKQDRLIIEEAQGFKH